MTRLLVVTNRAAGSAHDEAVAAALAVLRAGADVQVVDAADAAARDAALGHRDGRVPVVAGGDGSLHLAVEALARAGRLSPDDPLGLIPLGTGNDLARTLGIPLDGAAAARALLDGVARTLDLVVDEAGGVVVNAVHAGVGAVAAQQAATWKGRLGPAAYAVGGALAGVTARGWRVSVEADGALLHSGSPVLMVGVANGRSIGGGAVLAPRAEPDDGWLDVVVATSTGPLARLGFGAALRDGEHVGRDDVIEARAREVTVHGEPFPLNSDGELSGPVTSRTWTLRPAAWSVLAPPRA